MSSVSAINPHLQSLKCPGPLRLLQAWVVWRFETLPGEAKPRKTPYYIGGGKRFGRQGTPEDRAQLATFEAARATAVRRGFDGVGFCPMPEFNIVALDFDDCMDASGQLLPEIADMIRGTYAEFSPSGRGVRAFFRGNLSNRKSHARKGWPFGFETFSSKGFVTVTGALTPDADLMSCDDVIEELTPGVQALYDLRFPKERERGEVTVGTSAQKPMGVTERQMRRALEVQDPGCDYDDWLDVGMALHHETSGGELGLQIWKEWSADWSEYPGDELLDAKWESFGRQESGRQVTFRTVLRRGNELGAGIVLDVATADDFEEIAEAADDFEVIEDQDEGKTEKVRFRGMEVVEFLKRPRPKWIIKGLIPQAVLSMIYGEPGSGKSFVALDLAIHVALGRDWRGCRTKRQKVVFIVAEGAGAFGMRIQAYCEHHDIDPEELRGWFMVIADAPQLRQAEDVKDLAKQIRAWGGKNGTGLVFVDTLARVTSGVDENSGQEMGLVHGHCAGIHTATGAMVVLVHHAGKDASKGPRGHSSTFGAVDMALEILRTPLGHQIRVAKQKDGDDTGAWAFALERVSLGVDDDLDPITSCVVVPLDALPVQQAKARRYKANEQLIVNAITTLTQGGETSVPFEAVITQAMAYAPPHTGTGRDTRRQNLKRAAEGICAPGSSYRLEEGYIHVD